MAADTNYIRHFIINVQDTIVDHKCLLFSSNNLYESWGDSIGSNISTMNRVEELLYHIADSANLPALSEIYPDTVFAWYDSLSRKIMLDEDLISESPAAFCFTGGHLNQAMCNPIPPSFPSGVPGSCAGVSDVFTIFYLPGGKPVLPFMNNKASAWIPQKSIFCTGSYTQAHFRGYDKAFYFKRIGTININISAFTPWHYVPFSGAYSMYNNKVSSFAHWQDL